MFKNSMDKNPLRNAKGSFSDSQERSCIGFSGDFVDFLKYYQVNHKVIIAALTKVTARKKAIMINNHFHFDIFPNFFFEQLRI